MCIYIILYHIVQELFPQISLKLVPLRVWTLSQGIGV